MPLESVELVPSPEVGSDLVAAMTRLIAQQGYEMLINEPIYVPSAAHFPDPLRATTGSIRRLIRRLMAYALLDDLDVALEVYDSDNPFDEVGEDGHLLRRPHHAAAWYAGTHEGVCQFGLDVRQLDDIEKLAGVLCHEVAHAFRDHHELMVRSADVEELLTDLTTVYLGFGVFTVNNAYRYRSEGSMDGQMVSHSWREESLGYLSPQALTFLLALQVTARGKGEEKRIRRQLEPTQQEMFDAATELIADKPEFVEELALPPRGEWPNSIKGASVAKAVTATLRKTPDVEPDEALFINEQDEALDNSGGSVFLVPENDSRFVAIVGATLGTAGGALMHDVIGSGLFVVIAVSAFIGYQIGKRRIRQLCSDADCQTRLDADARTCDGCGATVEDNVVER